MDSYHCLGAPPSFPTVWDLQGNKKIPHPPSLLKLPVSVDLTTNVTWTVSAISWESLIFYLILNIKAFLQWPWLTFFLQNYN